MQGLGRMLRVCASHARGEEQRASVETVLPRRVASLVVAALLLTIAPSALAQKNEPTPKRAVPDYEGRPPKKTTAGEVALWLPRILLAPLYFTTEYLLRRPIGAAITAAEKGKFF